MNQIREDYVQNAMKEEARISLTTGQRKFTVAVENIHDSDLYSCILSEPISILIIHAISAIRGSHYNGGIMRTHPSVPKKSATKVMYMNTTRTSINLLSRFQEHKLISLRVNVFNHLDQHVHDSAQCA